jgi:outer membrane receptor protein involved in Fe transport
MKVVMNTMLRTALLGSAAAASLLALPSFAQAQAAQEVGVDEIVVTGSRIRRDTFSAPVPLAVVSGEAIRESGQTSLGEVLLDQPTMSVNTNAQSSSSSLFLAGQARADIRGLGTTRTLVLMDGRRIVFSDASSPGVDLNLIPNLMIERVDVVPGGASAVYGSEAIAGVVNVIMRKELDGVEFDVQAGISEEGDGEEWRIGAIAGRRFMDDRLSVLIGGEVSRSEPIMQKDREELYPGIRRNNALNPQTIVPQSRTNTTPFGTFQLRPTVAVTRDVRDPTQIVTLTGACATATVGALCQDPALFYGASYNALQGRTERGLIRGYAEYDLTDNVKAFLDVSFARVDGYGIFQPAFTSATGGGTLPLFINGDNAFLNGGGTTAAQLRTAFTTNGLPLTAATRIPVARFFAELGGRDAETRRTTTRVVGGMEGEFETFNRNFNWDWYAQYGKTTGTTVSTGIPYIERTQFAVDAINVNGQIVCRATTSTDAAIRARAAGCVPFDLVNSPSRESLLYINGVSTTDQEVKQTVVSGNIGTELFNLPAGPLAVSIGGEYRKEESFFEQDPIGASGALFYNAIGTRQGEYDVTEVYGEVRVPLLKDVFLAKELTFEAAGRIADYSTIGRTEQWRLAATWAPVEDIRIRASQATAVRAPNIVELFSPGSVNFTATGIDPCDRQSFAGATAAQQAARRITCAAAIPGYNPATFTSSFGTGRPSLELRQGGNPDLGPETADTYALGAVIQPRWIPRLQLSFDWFKYNIEDQVGTIPLNTLLAQLCYDSTVPYASNEFCSLIVRDPTGAETGVVGGVDYVVLTNQNVAKVKVEGYDASIAYGFNSEDMFGRNWGDFAFRVDVTRMYNFALQGLPGQAYTQLANTITNATPEWKGSAAVQWTMDNWTVNYTGHYIGSMIPTTAFTASQLDPFWTGDYYTHDLRVRYRFNEDMSIRAGILNFTDEYPPYLPETFAGTGAGSSQYDNRGRFFYVGATFRY